MPPEFEELARKVNNWGRWGDDDEIGTLNLITPEAVARGAACVKRGRTFSLAIPLSLDGPQLGFIPGHVNPLRTMIAINRPLTGDPDQFCSSDDIVVMALQAATHWDSLAHVSYGGRLYNGFPAAVHHRPWRGPLRHRQDRDDRRSRCAARRGPRPRRRAARPGYARRPPTTSTPPRRAPG